MNFKLTSCASFCISVCYNSTFQILSVQKMASKTRSSHETVLGDVKYRDIDHDEMCGGRQAPTGVRVIGRIQSLTRDTKVTRQEVKGLMTLNCFRFKDDLS